jgi:hypothetical protein
MSEQPRIYSNTLILLGSKSAERAAQQEACRKSQQMFLHRKVFNTSVDKFVEINAAATRNLRQVNVLARIALLVCNIGLFCFPGTARKLSVQLKRGRNWNFRARKETTFRLERQN